MSNLYVDLATFKGRMNISGTGDDAKLLVLLRDVSRAIDVFCNRFFYSLVETRYFDGSAAPLLLDRDLIAVTTLKSDDNTDGVFETAWAASDYLLLPYSGNPKTAIAVNRASNGTKSHFNPGRQRVVELAGRWGYDETIEASGAAISQPGGLSLSATSVTVSDGTKLNAGETALVDSEQMWVSAIAGNALTIERGKNGTAAASHADGAAVSVYRYHRAIVEAAMVLAGRAWRRRDLQFVVNPAAGGPAGSITMADLDPEVRPLLAPFRKTPVVAV